ncbi:MAG: hypothetical protein JW734_02830 [Candidatus Omnitrophica bacterium]|nr:hypothetical protein [Candidatus Omnitrophota bacterium]
MPEYRLNVSVRKLSNNPNMFEFTVSTPVLRSQFRLPRSMVNKLRILLEKALVEKKQG